MSVRFATLVGVMTVLLASAGAWAHPHPYLLGTDLVSITESEDTDDVPDIGGVRFAPGEVTADGAGFVTFTIRDAVFDNTGGLVCQDLNADGVCGDDGTIGGPVEPNHPFCITVSVSGLSFEQDILLFLDGPIAGNPAFGGCDPATTGEVDHS